MTIQEIAYKINKIASKGNHEFSKIQQIRSRNGFSPRAKSPFASFSIKEDYAFHAGGRKEFQFNLGQDYVNETDVFRYGIAFSLNEDRTIHNSKLEFHPAIERFNQFITGDKEFFKDYHMWYYSNNSFGGYFEEVKHIDEILFQAENFIFIGNYLNKKIEKVDEADLVTIVNTFDYFMPLYEFVQFGERKVEKRIARICWNDNGWIMPSGKYGKSLNVDTHEAQHGFGHEEWLLDIGKLIDGYHYGFLEPIRKQHDAYASNTFNVWLYTINGETKKRYWIGEIQDLYVLNKEEAEKAKAEYIKRGWLQEMEQQIRASGANSNGFSNWKGVDIFNIKYLPSCLKINDLYFEVPKGHAINEQSRYSFAHFKNEFDLRPNDEQDKFSFNLSNQEQNIAETNSFPETKIQVREPKSIEITYLHKVLSQALVNELRQIYGNKNVQEEHSAGYGGNKIDVVVRDGAEFIFYEIKSYTSLKTSIREAIGQLMEYCFWTNQRKAKKLIVITQPLDDFESARIYFKHLRDNYNLPLYYQSFDLEKKVLSEIV